MSEQFSNIKSLAAYEAIRELILTGEALAGSRLVIADLEQRLGIGRGPIREALMRLDRSGLVQNLPHRGAIVTPPPSLREMEHVYMLRVNLESVLAVEAMYHATDEDITALEERIRLMHKDPEGVQFFHLDRSFHSAMYSLSKMPHLLNILDSLFDHVEIFLTTHYYRPQDREHLCEQHEQIMVAFKSNDADALRSAISTNVLIGLELIRAEMARLNPSNAKQARIVPAF